MKYLYGASVKKIQPYIFGSSRLKEIAGASELVDYICTDLFQDFVKNHNAGEYKTIIGAAGNIRMLTGDRNLIEKIMLLFPKKVEETAPGVQFIQTVVEITGDKLTKADTNRLEQQLREKIPSASPYKDWSVTFRSPRSGKPAVGFYKKDEKDENGEPQDIGTKLKIDAVDKHWKNLKSEFGVQKFIADADEIAGINNYIAVIHADGNSLGQTIMKLGGGENYENDWQKFSLKLDEATKRAAKRAFSEIFPGNKKKFRPIILGGDDLTVVCAGENAIPFTAKYLAYFEEESSKYPVLGKLTACAGVAYIKKSFPFYYGAKLAEMLCTETKKAVKEMKKEKQMDHVPSSFMFAAESGGYVDSSFNEMKKRSLTAGEISFVFGPYGIHEKDFLPLISDLQKAGECLKRNTSLKNGLRELQKELFLSEKSAEFRADRIETIAKEKKENALAELKELLQKLNGITNSSASLYNLLTHNSKTPVYDLLLITDFASINEEKEND